MFAAIDSCCQKIAREAGLSVRDTRLECSVLKPWEPPAVEAEPSGAVGSSTMVLPGQKKKLEEEELVDMLQKDLLSPRGP